jgi:hypothetical protein
MNLVSRVLYEVWPRPATIADINPDDIFARYREAVEQIKSETGSSHDDKLLEISWKLFDNDADSRNSIDSRASALMPAITIAATLVVGVGFNTFKDTSKITSTAAILMLVTYGGALIYLTRTVLVLFRVHGKATRSTPDPSDIVPPPGADSPYSRQVATKILSYTIDNYTTNNLQIENLAVAQRAFRNGLLIIVFGGLATAFAFVATSHAVSSETEGKLTVPAKHLRAPEPPSQQRHSSPPT